MSEQSMSAPENSVETQGRSSASSERELDDLNILNFPSDIDWSTTLVVRCDPSGAPYKISDVYTALYNVVRRNDVYNLGATQINYAFTISFKSIYATENFVRYLKNKRSKGVTVKNLPCTVSRVPTKCVTIKVRWIPIEVDSAHIVNVLKQYGTIVKTELLQSNMRGWFHVYTNERKFTFLLNKNVDANDLPFAIEVKGLLGGVHVLERNPQCLECYHSGHNSESCQYKGCPLYKEY